MADTDLIARVYPLRGGRTFSIETITKNPRCMPPLEVPPQPIENRGARESTEPLPDDYKDSDVNLRLLPYIELRFRNGPRASSGFVFGKDPYTCDIVLPDVEYISRRHFAVTYKRFDDGYYRLIVRDLDSTCGTAVAYDRQKTGSRMKFDWIIGGFKFPDRTELFTVKPHKHLKFLIVVARHNITSPTYIRNVQQFLHGTAGAEHLLNTLGLQSGIETERHSQVHSPNRDRILLFEGWIARGTFGMVSHYWDVSTGKEYACKEPLGEYKKKAWENEINIMKSISHEHIVRLCFSEMVPKPRMFLEYMPLGNLDQESTRSPITYDESIIISHQSLSALAYLHGRAQPVAHRDLKPENILVHSRGVDSNPNYLHVKLADFGLSKEGRLKTLCGTRVYLPPEMQNGQKPEGYTLAVDIWSLGVVILQYAYGLPPPHPYMDHEGIQWCEKIVRHVSGVNSEGLINILRRMLVIDGNMRPSATACLGETSRLVTLSQGRFVAPSPASYAAGYGAMHHIPQEGYEGERQETLRGPPHSGGNASSAETIIYNPPEEPTQVWRNTPSNSHLSAQQVIDDHDGTLYIVIRQQQRVSMRTSDYHVNISEAMTAAGLSKNERAKHIRELRKRTEVTNENGRLWAPFEHSVPFCLRLGLEELNKLFSCRPQPPFNREDSPILRHHFGLSQGSVNQLPSIPVSSDRGGPSGEKGSYENRTNDEIAARRNWEPELTDSVATFDPRNSLADSFGQSKGIDESRCTTVGNFASCGPDAGSIPHNSHNEIQLETENAPMVEADHISRYTERSYANGSYLAPPNRSYEQLLKGVQKWP
ncbi:hypothetical protein GQX73_g9537 [Xylaria multiplex]|uniref:non-specific serine/threonine protein kinase n=1 Tax=Xylaria multiplex TaxID=323545 RepID=A0A7C8MYM2_9PEZI|nr:hypothetical protein GQX73_g9537 [Xylaria multiplex]